MTNSAPQKNSYRQEIRKSIEKVVVNIGIGRLSQQPNFEEKILPQVSRDLSSITGQKPEIRKARKSIAGFKIREGQIVGLKVTLRRERMVDFFERLVRIVLPRVRDFNGLSLDNIDSTGILNIGVKEQIVFPELDPDESILSFPLGINIVPKIKKRQNAIDKYYELGVPLKRAKGSGKKN